MKVSALFLLLINFSVISKESINEIVCNAHTNVEAKKKCYSDFGINLPEEALEPKNMRVAAPIKDNKKVLCEGNSAEFP